MAYLTCNGAIVQTATLIQPRTGAWVADVAVDIAAKITGAATLLFLDGQSTWTGFVQRSDVYQDSRRIRLVGGAGGLSKTCAPKYFRQMPMSLLLKDAIANGGEALSSTCDAATLAVVLPKWTRARMGPLPVALELSRLCDAASAAIGSTVVWRVLIDGTVYVGPETWPNGTTTGVDLLAYLPEKSRAEFSGDLPLLAPATLFAASLTTGVTALAGKKISQVVHSIAAEKVRSEAFFETTDTKKGDRVADPIRQLVRVSLDEARVDFSVLYPGTVVTQSGSNVDVTLDRADIMPGVTNVPLKHGIPGSSVTLNAGARVYVGFENKDPQRPFATIVDATAAQLSVVQLAGGSSGIARVGDSVNCGYMLFNSGLYISSFPGTPAGLIAGTAAQIALPGSVLVPLTGAITSGMSKFQG